MMNYNNKNKSELTWIIKMLIDKNKMQKQTIIKQEKMLDTLYLDKIKLKPLKKVSKIDIKLPTVYCLL